MKRYLSFFSILFFFSFNYSCLTADSSKRWVRDAKSTAASQLASTAAKYDGHGLFPRTYENGEVVLVDPLDWTSGFFPGSLWLMYELTGDAALRKYAESYTARLHDIQYYDGTHDLGFMVFCSYGNQYRILKDSVSAAAIVQASEMLISRMDPSVGLIRSWDFGTWNYPVIIDNMMNLEMLFWASGFTGNPKYRDVAVRHADNTIRNHYRDDYSSYHVVSYNDDGSVESRGTYQGWSDDSAWARGQAWGLYGYTMCYRETGMERYLDHARKQAAFIINHPNMPDDLVPYWDFDAPDIPHSPRDASAAAVIASALLELSTLDSTPQAKHYFDYAEKILRNLSGREYIAAGDNNGGFILKHSVGFLPKGVEIDAPLNYADYYYLEGLKRYVSILGTR